VPDLPKHGGIRGEETAVKAQTKRTLALICIFGLLATAITIVVNAQQQKVSSSYGPTNQDMTFAQIKAARLAVKAERAKEHMDLLNSRYVLAAKTTS
jgi:hypothetical protein